MIDFKKALEWKHERLRIAKLFDDVAKGIKEPNVLDGCKGCHYFDEEKFDCEKHCICPYVDRRGK